MSRNLLKENRENLIIGVLIFISYIILHLIFQRHDLLAYDMYAYTSFAEHYAENWFYTVVPEQAHGLEIVSYPPLIFHIMSILSFIPFLDQATLSIVLMSISVTALSFSFYWFISLLLNYNHQKFKPVIFLIAFSPGMLKFSLVHGQLPFITGLIFSSLSCAFFYKALKGEETRVKLFVCLLLTAYTHHFSLLVTIIMIAGIASLHLKDSISRIEYFIPPLLISSLLALIGLYPMIRETLFGISQEVIAHGSRKPLHTLRIFNQFVTTTYGATVLGLLVVLKKKKRFHTVNILSLIFLTLGIGLATPTPEILFGRMSTFLVYDKFALISSLFLAGILGFYLIQRNFSWRDKDIVNYLILIFVISSLITVFWANRIHLGSYTGYGKHDINQTETAIEYLNENASDNYLYQTAGHGTPVEEIRRQTSIPTLDTGYFQGRKHTILTDRGKFDRLSPNEFRRVVKNADKVSLKYIITFSDDYDEIFNSADWNRKRLDQGVDILINRDVDRYNPDLGQKRILFGTMPLLVLTASIILLLSNSARDKIDELFNQVSSVIKSGSKWQRESTVWILVLPLIAAAPSFLTSGYPAGVDTPAHIFKPELMAQMVQRYGKVFYWTNQWYNGYPFMAMYPPIPTKLIYYIQIFVGNITISYNLVRLISISSISYTLYLLSEKVTSDKRVRILTAALAVFSYPLYSNLYTVGRLASALALPIYILIIHLLFREDIFQENISIGHIMIALSSSALFLTHSMLAYLFLYTGVIFCLVYREKVTNIGMKPILITFAIPLILAFPYLARLIQHFSITDPSWYVEAQSFEILKHLKPVYSIVPPSYVGLLQTAFFSIGILKTRIEDKFFQFSLINFLFFFTAYWARNYRIAYFIPLSRQFDLARFEIIFVVFGILVASYGLRYVFNIHLKNIQYSKKNLFAALIVALIILQSVPMFFQSANWEPNFEHEIDKIELEENYRSIGVDMRQWHTYFFFEMDTMNTFGWFNQANPNPTFTRYLQRSGGRWRGWNFIQDIEDNNFRNNLLELSNTKYIISPKGDWFKERFKQQIKGQEPQIHPLNEELMDEVSESEKFVLRNSSDHLEVYEFNRSMSYCEGVRPVWIDEDYGREARSMLRDGRMLPEIPVKGKDPGIERNVKAKEVTCNKENPYTISIDVEDSGWVLVKESYYPFWQSSEGNRVFSGFGFLVIHVEEDLELKYKQRSISTLDFNDMKSLYG